MLPHAAFRVFSLGAIDGATGAACGTLTEKLFELTFRINRCFFP